MNVILYQLRSELFFRRKYKYHFNSYFISAMDTYKVQINETFLLAFKLIKG